MGGLKIDHDIFISRIVLGEALTARVTLLDNGVNVLVTGGICTHVGSISVAQPVENGTDLQADINLTNIVLPGHYDNEISDKFACTLARALNCTATVECGVHYDKLSSSGIKSVLSASEELLQDLIAALRDRYSELAQL